MTTLDVRGLTVTFPGVGTVVDGVDLRLGRGRCLAIVGESGAGKSVLARALLGLAGEGGAPARVEAASLEIVGTQMRSAPGRSWRRLRGDRVGFVLQDALGSLDPLRTIGAEVASALAVRRVPRTQRGPAAVAALARAGLAEPELQAARRSGEMSGGMRQRALIAAAIIAGPDLLIADEPTTALDATVAAGVLDLLGDLREGGTSILLITHDLRAVARIADDIAVMQGGRIVETGPAVRVLTAPTHPHTRALVAALPTGPRPRRTLTHGAPALTARGLTRTYRLPGGGRRDAVADLDLDLAAGQILGVVGESGSGKSTLARLLIAEQPPDAGTVDLFGQPWSAASEAHRRPRRARIRLIPQDPLGSFDPRLSAGTILTQAGGDPDTLLPLVDLPTTVATRRPRSLSGGMRQRLAIARALAANPDVLILDEPVSALDVTVQARIIDLLNRLHAELGLAMVFISHDLAVVRQLCETVLVMDAGRVVETGPVEQVWAHPNHPVTRALLAAAA